MWIKIKNIENSLFLDMKEQLGTLTAKEEKLIKILDFAQIENNITVVKITNTPKRQRRDSKSIYYKVCLQYANDTRFDR